MKPSFFSLFHVLAFFLSLGLEAPHWTVEIPEGLLFRFSFFLSFPSSSREVATVETVTRDYFTLPREFLGLIPSFSSVQFCPLSSRPSIFFLSGAASRGRGRGSARAKGQAIVRDRASVGSTVQVMILSQMHPMLSQDPIAAKIGYGSGMNNV